MKIANQHTDNLAMQFIEPFTWSISRKMFQAFCISLGAYLLWYTCVAVLGFGNYGIGHFQTFRLRIEYEGRSSKPNPNFSIALVQLQLDGCTVWSSAGMSPAVIDDIAGGWPFVLPFVVDTDGFAVVFNASAAFSAYLELQGTSDNGTSWVSIASSSSRLVAEGVRFLPKTTPMEGGTPLRFANQLDWPLVVDSAVESIVLAFGCFSTALSGVLNWPVLGKKLFALSAALQAMSNLVVVAGNLSLGQPQLVFSPAVAAAALAALAWVLFAAEIVFADTLCVAGLAILVARVMQE